MTNPPLIPGARNWYDRSYGFTQISFSGDAIAPHAVTTRATYTCPAGKKAILLSGHVSLVRVTAATTVGRVLGAVTALGVGRVVGAWIRTNVIGDKDKDSIGQSCLITAAQTIELVTQDLSVGGTIDYRMGATIGQFDAG